MLAAVAFVPLFVMPQLSRDYVGENFTPKQGDYTGVLELWHVEGFEGGTVSRAAWLQARAVEFEREHPQLFVLVKEKTLSELSAHILKGEVPDIISFSAGIGADFIGYAREISVGADVRGDLLRAGVVGGRQLAVPYMLGGYAIIGNAERLSKADVKAEEKLSSRLFTANYKYRSGKNEREMYSVSVGTGGFCLPLMPFYDNIAVDGYARLVSPDFFEAYNEFMSFSRSTMLLGTQRDLARILARRSQNTCPELRVEYVDGFSDLVQFAAVTSRKNAVPAELFAEYLCGGAQRTVVNCGMFAVDGLKHYAEPLQADMERALNRPLITLNAFTAPSELLKLRAAVYAALNGSEADRRSVGSYFE
ncbi:MAG: hypothetical protein LBS99_01685 [Clostridiales bacterium]|jgi:hypothetical protein|nr:hypothetical protein [Clostridiales bacterium]